MKKSGKAVFSRAQMGKRDKITNDWSPCHQGVPPKQEPRKLLYTVRGGQWKRVLERKVAGVSFVTLLKKRENEKKKRIKGNGVAWQTNVELNLRGTAWAAKAIS